MVSASQVSRLKLASQGAAFTWLLLKVPDGRRIAAVPVLKKRGGILLAIPLLALTEEELAQKAIAGVTDDLGPTETCPVRGVPPDDLEEGHDMETEVILLDWPSSGNQFLEKQSQAPAMDNVIQFRDSAGAAVLRPDAAELHRVADEFVNGGGVRTEGYQTAEEAPLVREKGGAQTEVLDATLQQMQSMQAQISALQAGPKAGQEASQWQRGGASQDRRCCVAAGTSARGNRASYTSSSPQTTYSRRRRGGKRRGRRGRGRGQPLHRQLVEDGSREAPSDWAGLKGLQEEEGPWSRQPRQLVGGGGWPCQVVRRQRHSPGREAQGRNEKESRGVLRCHPQARCGVGRFRGVPHRGSGAVRQGGDASGNAENIGRASRFLCQGLESTQSALTAKTRFLSRTLACLVGFVEVV